MTTRPFIKCISNPKGRKTLYELHSQLCKREGKPIN